MLPLSSECKYLFFLSITLPSYSDPAALLTIAQLTRKMPIPRYGVWKGKPLSWKGTARPDHGYLNFTDSSGGKFETAVNVMSKSDDSCLVYWVFRDFDETLPLVKGLKALSSGFHAQNGANSLGLDFLRGGFLDVHKGILLSHDAPGESHDILEYLDPILNQAVGAKANLYIYGQRYHNGGMFCVPHPRPAPNS